MREYWGLHSPDLPDPDDLEKYQAWVEWNILMMGVDPDPIIGIGGWLPGEEAAYRGYLEAYNSWVGQAGFKEKGYSPSDVIVPYLAPIIAATGQTIAGLGEDLLGAATFSTKPAVPADARAKVMLERQLASEQQMSEEGYRMAGAGTDRPLRIASRLAVLYGGNPADWSKMTSSSYRGADGMQFETHWYQNALTGLRVEFKVKIISWR